MNANENETDTVPTTQAAYVVSNEARGICIYATCDYDDAVSYCQINADRDLAIRPNSATPHYVIKAWGNGQADTHIYGR